MYYNKPTYSDTYAYHDIDAHKDYIASNIKRNGLSDYKYVLVQSNNNLKPNEICAPGYKNGERVKLVKVPGVGNIDISDEYIVNNTELLCNEFGVVIKNNSNDYDFDYDIVQIMKVG